MLTRRLLRGVTLIEMLIGLAVLGMLVSLAVPSFMVWMQNTQIRNAADAVLNGMQLARSEALRRNKLVQFALTSQSGWKVQIVKPSAGEKKTVQQRDAAEGSANVNVTPTPGGAYAVTFDTMGGPTGNLDGSLPLSSLQFTSQVSNAAIRPLNIVVSQSGTIRMCDPNVPAGDSRGC